MKLICDKCNYPIATIDKHIKMPVQGSMFTSKDPKHGFPPPWSPVTVPEFMYCPMCNKRPFIGEYSRDMESIVMLVMDEVDPDVAYEITITDKGFQEPQDEADESESTDTRTDAGTGEGSTAAGQDDPGEAGQDDPSQTDLGEDAVVKEEDVVKEAPPVSVAGLFAKMIEDGVIVQKGSWFTYKGNNYRRDELLEIIGK